MKMFNRPSVWGLTFAALLMMSQTGCKMSCSADDGPLEEAAENVEEAAEDVGDAIDVDIDD